MFVQPLRYGFQLTADLVFGERSSTLDWTVRSWRIVGSGGCGFPFRISGMISKVCLKPLGLSCGNLVIPQVIQHLAVIGRALV